VLVVRLSEEKLQVVEKTSFFGLFEVCVVNAHCLHNIQIVQSGVKALSHFEYRRRLIKQLIENHKNEPSRKRRRPSGDSLKRLDDALHVPGKLPQGKNRDCVVCSVRGAAGPRKTTNFICETCDNQPAMHIPECFKKFHTEKKYR